MPAVAALVSSGGRPSMADRAARFARRHDQHPLDGVAQLADVAGPLGGLHARPWPRRLIGRGGRPEWRAAPCMKCRASSGMSIRRSASGGITSGTTFKR